MTVLVFDYTVLYHIFNHCVLHNSKIDEVHLLQVQWSPGDVQNCSRLGQGQLSCQEVRLFFLFLFFSSGSSLKFKVCGKSLRKLDFFSSLFFFFAWLESPVYDAECSMHFLLLWSNNFQVILVTSSDRRGSVCHNTVAWIISNPTLGGSSGMAKGSNRGTKSYYSQHLRETHIQSLPSLSGTDTQNHKMYLLLLGMYWQNNIMVKNVAPEIRLKFEFMAWPLTGCVT